MITANLPPALLAPQHVIVSADVSGLEMATLAQVLLTRYGLEGLARKINNDVDLHTEVAALLLGCSYEEALRRVKAGDKEAKNARSCAKVANFGFPGGMSSDTLVHFALQSYGLVLTPAFTAELKRIWQKANPDIAAYLKAIRRYQDRKTKRYNFEIPGTGLTRRGATYCSCANGQFQGLGAACVKCIATKVARETFTRRDSPLWGTRPINFIHDEILQETPLDERLHPAATRLEELFFETFPEFCPDVRMKTEAVAMFYWSKDADRREDDEGRLIPWPTPKDLKGQKGARVDRILEYWDRNPPPEQWAT